MIPPKAIFIRTVAGKKIAELEEKSAKCENRENPRCKIADFPGRGRGHGGTAWLLIRMVSH